MILEIPLKRFILEQLAEQCSSKSTKRRKLAIYEETFPLDNPVRIKEDLRSLRKNKFIKNFKEKYGRDLDYITIKIQYFPAEIKQRLQEKYSQSHYEELLRSFNVGTLNKMKKIIGIIEEEINLRSETGNICHLQIEKSKFTKAGIPISDVSKILRMFSEDENYWILPWFSSRGQTEKSILIEFLSHELYKTNLKNFKQALGKTLQKQNKPPLIKPMRLPETEIERLPKISYDSVSGIGYVNDKRFKFKDDQPEYKIFEKLYKRIGKKLLRKKVLKIMGIQNEEPFLKEPKWIRQKKKDTEVTDTYRINEIVKKIRKRTELTPDELVNNNGNLILRAQKVKNHP